MTPGGRPPSPGGAGPPWRHSTTRRPPSSSPPPPSWCTWTPGSRIHHHHHLFLSSIWIAHQNGNVSEDRDAEKRGDGIHSWGCKIVNQICPSYRISVISSWQRDKTRTVHGEGIYEWRGLSPWLKCTSISTGFRIQHWGTVKIRKVPFWHLTAILRYGGVMICISTCNFVQWVDKVLFGTFKTFWQKWYPNSNSFDSLRI